MSLPLVSIRAHLEALAAGRVTSRRLVEDCLAAAVDPGGEGPSVFLRVYTDTARAAADRADRERLAGRGGPLAGLPVSIKDLFDVEGETTRAGSLVLGQATPAVRDATVVWRLREAGAVLIGRTNMTEFAFSGLGINPHYGTPRNPYDRELGRIPGGSSSGAAVSVSDGMAAAGIGSDTGGSLRIPAALCGMTGFKPTARRVPLDGMLPLSPSLDSIGPIAPTVDCCRRIDAVLSGMAMRSREILPISGLRLGVLQGYVLEGLDAAVGAAFERALHLLSRCGAQISEARMASLERIPELNCKGGLAAAESYRWHRKLLEREGARYDARVRSRILRGKEIGEGEYRELLVARQAMIVEARAAFAGIDAWVLPTVPRIAPTIAATEESDDAYYEANAAMLRNPSIFNFLDGCAISLPCHLPGEVHVGLMLAMPGGQDEELFQIASTVEDVLAGAGCAILGRAAV